MYISVQLRYASCGILEIINKKLYPKSVSYIIRLLISEPIYIPFPPCFRYRYPPTYITSPLPYIIPNMKHPITPYWCYVKRLIAIDKSCSSYQEFICNVLQFFFAIVTQLRYANNSIIWVMFVPWFAMLDLSRKCQYHGTFACR